jgi:hypothetical protein
VRGSQHRAPAGVECRVEDLEAVHADSGVEVSAVDAAHPEGVEPIVGV